MAKEREDMDEGLEDPAEALVADEAQLTAEVSHREEGEVEEGAEPYSTDHDKAHANEPPSQPELQASSLTASDRGMDDARRTDEEAPALSQRDFSSIIDGATAGSDPLHEEIKPVLEKDADLSDAPLTDIEPGPDDRRSEPFEAPAGDECERDESFAKEKPITDLVSEDTTPSIDSTNYRKTFSDDETVAGETERGVDVNLELPDAPPINVGSGAEEEKSEPLEAQFGNKRELGESSVKDELMAPVAQENMGHGIDEPSVEETTNNSEGLPAETNLGVKSNEELADAPLIDVQPGLAESESVPPFETQIRNDLESDDLLVREEETTGVAQDDLVPGDREFPGKPTLEGSQKGMEPDVELPDAPLSNIEPIDERGPVPFEARSGNKPELVEGSLEEEPLTGVAHEDLGLGPDNVTTPPDSMSAGIDQGFDENSVAKGYVVDDEQLENIEAAIGQGPVDIEPEVAAMTPVKTDEGAATEQSELSEDLTMTQPEAVSEMDLIGDVAALDMETGTAPVDVLAERDKEPAAVERDAGAHLSSIEPEAAADTETAVETEDGFSGTQLGVYQETGQMKSGLDAGEIEPGMETGVESEPERPPDISPDIYAAAAPKSEEVEEEENGDSGNEVSIEPSYVGPSKDNIDEAGSFGEACVKSEDVARQESERGDGSKPVNEALSDMGPEADTQVLEPEMEVPLDTKFEENDDSGKEVSNEPLEAGTQVPEPDGELSFDTKSEENGDLGNEVSIEPPEAGTQGPEPEVEVPLDTKSEENDDSGNKVSMEPPEADTQVPEPEVQVPLDTKFEENDESGNEVSIEPSDAGPSKDDMDETGSFGEAGVKSEDITRQESELVDGCKPVNEALSDMGPEADTEVAVRGVEVPLDTEFDQAVSYETESNQQDGIVAGQGEKVDYVGAEQKEIDSVMAEQGQQNDYMEGEQEKDSTESPEFPVVEPEAEVETIEVDPKVEDLSKSKLDEESPFEFDRDQQEVLAVEQDQLQGHQRERERDPSAEGPEVTAPEATQNQALPSSATAEGELTASEREGVTLASAGAALPADEQEKLNENDGDSDVLLENKQGSSDADQSGETKESSFQQEYPYNFFQENGFSGDAPRSTLPIKQEQKLEIEQPSMSLTDNDEMASPEETHEAEAKGSQPAFDKQELNYDTKPIDEASGELEMAEESVNAVFPFKSESSVDKYEPTNQFVFEQGGGLESPSGDTERDIGEEEAAMSTAAEAGSAITDFDENPSYQQLSTEFTGSEQDAGITESRKSGEAFVSESNESNDSSPRMVPDFIGMGPSEHVESDSGQKHRKEDSLKEEVEWKASQDLEPTVTLQEDTIGMPEVETTVTSVPESLKVPADVHVSEESNEAEEVTTKEAGGSDEPSHGTVSSALRDLQEDNSNTAEPALSISKAKPSTGVPVGELPLNTSNKGPAQVTSGQDMNDTEGLSQQKVRDASLPMGVPVQDMQVKQRALDQENLRVHERPNREGTLQRGNNLLGCCGMFDLLLGKN